MKAERKIFKGIEYVQFTELPQDQQDQFAQTLSHDVFIKILMNGVIVSKCIQYHDYQNWFDKMYRVSAAAMVHKTVAEKIAASAKNLTLERDLVPNT